LIFLNQKLRWQVPL